MMKHLVSTTAIVFALTTPAWAQTYTAASVPDLAGHTG